ncbi:hypothetical protein E2C01_034803 [Portunus trituberculatus]|uniref:Uncharacterized protein n=1 Tax=Portunus trituberculatus TaxID=210409 RepID=A0A5B7F7B5_PORTR|nr:hypothetical protein [Portunus trituberculatus]
MDAISRQEVALRLLKNLESSSRSTRDRGREPANHSKAAAFDPSPNKFKPRKFAKTNILDAAQNKGAQISAVADDALQGLLGTGERKHFGYSHHKKFRVNLSLNRSQYTSISHFPS